MDAVEHVGVSFENMSRRVAQHLRSDATQEQLAAAWAASIPELYRFKHNVRYDGRGAPLACGAIIMPAAPQGIVDKWFEALIRLRLTEE
ncbi:MAG: hypothetical protein WBX25_19225 [Rhodomicrobium sp.]